MAVVSLTAGLLATGPFWWLSIAWALIAAVALTLVVKSRRVAADLEQLDRKRRHH